MLDLGLSLGRHLDGAGSEFPECILGLSATPDTGIFQHTFAFLGNFDITVKFATTYRSNQILFGDAHLLTLYFNISETSGITVWSEGFSWNFSTVGFDLWDGKQHTITYKRRGTEFQIIIDGVASGLADFAPLYVGDNNFRIGDSNVRHDYFRGSIISLTFYDYVNATNNLVYRFNSGSLVYELPDGHAGDETSPVALLYENLTTDNWVCGNQWMEVGTDGLDNYGFLLDTYGAIYPPEFGDEIAFSFSVNTTTNEVRGRLGLDGETTPEGVTSWLVKIQGFVNELELVLDVAAGYFGTASVEATDYVVLNLGSRIKIDVTPVYTP